MLGVVRLVRCRSSNELLYMEISYEATLEEECTEGFFLDSSLPLPVCELLSWQCLSAFQAISAGTP